MDEATGALVLAGIFTAFGGKEGTGVGSWSQVCSGQRVFKEISSESSLVLKHSVYAIYFFCSKSCARESLESWHMCGQLFRPCRDGHQILAAGHCRARGVCQHPKSPDSEIETSCFLYVLGLEMM